MSYPPVYVWEMKESGYLYPFGFHNHCSTNKSAKAANIRIVLGYIPLLSLVASVGHCREAVEDLKRAKNHLARDRAERPQSAYLQYKKFERANKACLLRAFIEALQIGLFLLLLDLFVTLFRHCRGYYHTPLVRYY